MTYAATHCTYDPRTAPLFTLKEIKYSPWKKKLGLRNSKVTCAQGKRRKRKQMHTELTHIKPYKTPTDKAYMYLDH